MSSDEELMAAYVAGDRQAFHVLFQRYAPVLLRLMLRELHVREEANDLVQQTFLQVHRARMDFDQRFPFKPWLFTIAMNLKREYFRRRRRRPESPLEPDTSGLPVTAGSHEQADARRSLSWAFQQLSPENREIIELHWFSGLSFTEVAERMGISVAAAKVRAHRSYARLRELLDPEPSGPLPRNPERDANIG